MYRQYGQIQKEFVRGYPAEDDKQAARRSGGRVKPALTGEGGGVR